MGEPAGPFTLWPTQEAGAGLRPGADATVGDVEALWEGLFPHSNPVVFSSARAGLSAALACMGLGRADLVFAPLYSSHCVLEAIARVATPTPVVPPGGVVSAALVVHQWGYVHTPSLSASRGIVEDAVDTLFVPGEELFCVGGRFVLVSLPKILGGFAGGIVGCASRGDRAALALERDKRAARVERQFELKRAAMRDAALEPAWAGGESLAGAPATAACADIARRLHGYERAVRDVQANLRAIRAAAMGGFDLHPGRLPSNVVVAPAGDRVQRARQLGFATGVRHFAVPRTAPAAAMVPVLPIPVHLQVPAALLGRLAAAMAATPGEIHP